MIYKVRLRCGTETRSVKVLYIIFLIFSLKVLNHNLKFSFNKLITNSWKKIHFKVFIEIFNFIVCFFCIFVIFKFLLFKSYPQFNKYFSILLNCFFYFLEVKHLNSSTVKVRRDPQGQLLNFAGNSHPNYFSHGVLEHNFI